MSSFRGRLFVWFQYLLPQHGVSRLILAATRVRTRWFKDWTIRGFLKLYRVDMTEAVETDPYRYATFNEFFTRALKDGARAIAAEDDAIACPVDGFISEAGTIDRDRLLQAKGRYYRLTELLAAQPWASRFEGGSFATIYLAPFNYHRVHMPLRGKLHETVFVPGRLFSVNAVTAQLVPGLFARNERVLTLFDSGVGQFALVLVGALNVGSIATVWAGDITPAAHRMIAKVPAPPTTLEKGAELGRFNMGSTVILLFEPNRARWLPGVASTCAGIGLLLVTIWQSKAQIDAAYGRLADSVITNHGTKIIFSGVSDPATLEYAARLLGDEEILRRSTTLDLDSGRRSISEAVHSTRLVPAHVLRQVRPGQALLVHGTLPPAHLHSRPYFRNRRLRRIAELTPRSDRAKQIPA